MTEKCGVKDKFGVCKKAVDAESFIWYSGDVNTTLCKSHYQKWSRFYGNPFKKLKSNTRKWVSACRKAQKVFDKWFDGGIVV